LKASYVFNSDFFISGDGGEFVCFKHFLVFIG